MTTGLHSIRVLLVDDNPPMLAAVTAMLRAVGLTELRQARQGAEALDILRREPADIALVDFLMRPTDGVHFTREVRNASDSPDVFLPIIMMTGHAERSRVEEARDAGVTEFLLKPVTPRTLVDRLNAVIQHPRPFVRSSGFFGPDRRRRADPAFLGPWRRRDDPRAVVI